MFGLQRLLCLIGKHHRNSERVRFDGSEFHSICKGCGRRMLRDEGGWVLEPDDGAR